MLRKNDQVDELEAIRSELSDFLLDQKYEEAFFFVKEQLPFIKNRKLLEEWMNFLFDRAMDKWVTDEIAHGNKKTVISSLRESLAKIEDDTIKNKIIKILEKLEPPSSRRQRFIDGLTNLYHAISNFFANLWSYFRHKKQIEPPPASQSEFLEIDDEQSEQVEHKCSTTAQLMIQAHEFKAESATNVPKRELTEEEEEEASLNRIINLRIIMPTSELDEKHIPRNTNSDTISTMLQIKVS